MEATKVKEVLSQVVAALMDLEQAKADCKLKIEAVFETYDFNGNQEKAVLKVAKAKISEKLDDLESEVYVLAEAIGIAQEQRQAEV